MGLRYGTLPVVARTGGLADTIIDANEAALASDCATGFQFAPINATMLGQCDHPRLCSLSAAEGLVRDDAPRHASAGWLGYVGGGLS